MKKLTILVIVVSFLVLFYGCCSHSGDAIFVKPVGDKVLTSREVIVDELGRVPTVTFPSGTKIEGLEENTLTPGIIVTIVEQKTASQNPENFSNNSYDGMYLYKITAYQSSSNTTGGKTSVTTTEKPLKITLPKTSNSQGIALAGIKESDTDPWRLFTFSDSNKVLPNDAVLTDAGTNTAENTFNLFSLGTQFALVPYSGNTDNNLPETYVTSLVASSTHSILVKDGKYSEDLTIKGIMKGVNLDSIKPTDLMTRISYRNNMAEETKIKVNGVNVSQTNKEDKTVPGYSYCHSFVVDSVNDYSLMGNEGEYSFTINLDGIETESFPLGFLIEFYNKVDSEKILPYSYTEFYSLYKKEIVEQVIEPDTGNIDDNGLYELTPTFTIAIGKELSDNDKQKIEDAISVSGVEADRITKTWDGYKLTIGFKDELEPGTTYTLKIDDVTDIDGVSIKDIEDLTFKTKSVNNSFTITYNLDGGEVATANPTTYGEASETFVLNEPSKKGYNFIGWTGSNGDVPQTTVTIDQGSTGDKAYTANWSAVAYTITYELNGGNLAEANPYGYNYASETFVLNEPTKEGYTFLGWTGSNGDTPEKTLSVVQGSITDLNYIANWAVNSYRLDIVKGTGINSVTGDGMHEYNEVVTASCTMLDGYEFDSWSGDFTTETFNMPASNATMTANAKSISYSIAYTLNDGIVATPNPTNYDVTSATITLNKPAKDYYTFIGWTGSNGEVPQTTVTIPNGSTGDKNYIASYTPISYSISYDLADGALGEGVSNPTNYDITSATITLNKPTKADYDFLGWEGTDIPDGTASMTVTIPQGSIGARSYVASYSEKYIITYDLNGGSVSSANPESYNIYSEDIILNNPVKTRTLTDGTYCFYLFVGWTGTDVEVATKTLTIPQGSSGDRTYTANWVELEMKPILAGTFTMGSPVGELGRSSNETQHQVTLSQDFWMGTYELTQDQYFAVMGTNPSEFKEGAAASVRPTTSANYPVENVSYNDITKADTGFLAQINTQLAGQIPTGYKLDLPTEAQWEYACRAGTTKALNNDKNLISTNTSDSNLSEVAWYKQNWGNENNKTHAVGALASNTWGLYDMHGNINEFCKDLYVYGYYGICGNCTDPVGPDTGSKYVVRGGSWFSDPKYCRSACRDSSALYVRSQYTGFRLALVKE